MNISSKILSSLLSDGEDVVLVDVRETDEFAQRHIDGALNWPLESLGDHLQTHSVQTSIVFICHSGQRSLQACSFAKMIGYKDVKSLEGGMSAWPN